jgi:hypothetical protein
MRIRVAVILVGVVLVGCRGTESDDLRDMASDFELAFYAESPEDGQRTYFGNVADVQVDGDGLVYVLDALSARVTVFGPDGSPQASFGGPGQGPAEFVGARRVLPRPDLGVLVADFGASRFVRFSAQGDPLGILGMPDTHMLLQDVITSTSGDVLALFVPGGLGALLDSDGSAVAVHYGWLEPDSGQVPRSIGSFSPPDNLSMERPPLFRSRPLHAVGPGGLHVLTSSSATEFAIRHRSGDTAAVVRMPGAPRRVSEEDSEAFTRALRRGLESSGMPPEVVSAAVSALTLGEFHPRLTAVMFGPDETVLVREPLAGEELLATSRPLNPTSPFGLVGDHWLMYSVDGEYLRRVRFPVGFEPLVFRSGLFYGVRTDDLGVQTVAAYRLLTADDSPEG